MNWLALVPSALSAISALTGKKPPRYNAPQFNTPQLPMLQAQPLQGQNINAPQVNYQGITAPAVGQAPTLQAPERAQLPSYANLFQQLNQQGFDPGQTALYQQLSAQMGGGLPPGYREALLGQAEREGQAAFERATRNLGIERERATRTAADQANRMGLLGSGSLAVRQGLIDEAYARQQGDLASNLQTQLGRVSTGLTEQDLAQRQRAMELLSQIEGQRLAASTTGRNALLSAALQEQGNQLGAQQENIRNAMATGQFNIGNLLGNQRFDVQNLLEAQRFNAGNQLAAQQFNVGNQMDAQRFNADQMLKIQQANFENALRAAQGNFANANTAAQNQYQSDLNRWQVGEANRGQLFDSLASAATTYGTYRRNRRRSL